MPPASQDVPATILSDHMSQNLEAIQTLHARAEESVRRAQRPMDLHLPAVEGWEATQIRKGVPEAPHHPDHGDDRSRHRRRPETRLTGGRR